MYCGPNIVNSAVSPGKDELNLSGFDFNTVGGETLSFRQVKMGIRIRSPSQGRVSG
jgi:hypothetical protein